MDMDPRLRERTEDMISRHGEVVRKSYAAQHILHCSTAKVRQLLEAHCLEYACGGTMIDMYSIARYICNRDEEEFKARQYRAAKKTNCKWRV